MKRLFFGVIMLVATVAIHAARAYSEPYIVSQPDGTQLTLILNGDEHRSWLTTTDGTIVVETPLGYCVATIDDDGELSSTGLMAHQPALRDAEEQQVCLHQQQRQGLFFQQVRRDWHAIRKAQVTDTDYFPHSGSPKCLVILVNFSDVAFTSETPREQFDQYMNGEVQRNLGHNESKNMVGVRKYFEASSRGQFTPQFDVVGPVTLPETMAYYGENNEKGKDKHFYQFCTDAIAAVDDNVNFKDYDNNDDDAAELVCIVYAGYGESLSGNPSNTIWPKCSHGNYKTDDGVRVNFINCSPELLRTNNTDINGIGLFCHEFSHGLGLPDLYATNVDAQLDNQSPEFWDLMDYGGYGGSTYTPVPYSVWEQEAMGWI